MKKVMNLALIAALFCLVFTACKGLPDGINQDKDTGDYFLARDGKKLALTVTPFGGYFQVSNPEKGNLFIYNQEGKCLYEAAHMKISDVYSISVTDTAKVKTWGWMDKDGNLVCEPSYASSPLFTPDYAMVKVDGKFGVVNIKKADEVLVPFDYAEMKFVVDGIFCAKKAEKDKTFVAIEPGQVYKNAYVAIEAIDGKAVGTRSGVKFVLKGGKETRYVAPKKK